MKDRSLYRRIALDRVSSPEQLDQVMSLVATRLWILLAAAVLLIGTAVVWALSGSIPTRVTATGVLIRTGGVYDVMPSAAGRISEIVVRPGDMVRRGQVVARLDQPETVEALRSSQSHLQELLVRHRSLEGHLAEAESLQVALAEREHEVLAQSLRAAREELRWIDSKVVGQRDLFSEGLIRHEDLLATEQRRNAIAIRIEQIESELQQLRLRHHAQEGSSARELVQSRHQVAAARREVVRLQADLEERTEIRALYDGRILEVTAEVGAQSRPGLALMRMDRTDTESHRLEAVIYIPGGAGKRVLPGMEVQLSPATVRREEHGYIIGEITSVSEFPSTQEAMNRTLKNPNLVQVLAGGVPPYEAFVTLRDDPSSTDGYAWSAASPGIAIHSGTLCTAAVTTHRRRPIELVAPYLRRTIGV